MPEIATARVEPTIGSPQPVAVIAPAPNDAARPALDQFARMEDKLARMEEKFSRTENMVARAQDSLDRAAGRVEDAARGVDAAELASEVAALRARVEKTPRLGGLMLTALVTAVATTVLLLLVLKFAPGLVK